MRESFPPVTINFGAVKIAGGPGLSLLVIVVAIAVEFPEAGWLLASGLVGGLMVGAALILVGRCRALIPQRHERIYAVRNDVS
jgi:hypothetical protein